MVGFDEPVILDFATDAIRFSIFGRLHPDNPDLALHTKGSSIVEGLGRRHSQDANHGIAGNQGNRGEAVESGAAQVLGGGFYGTAHIDAEKTNGPVDM